MIEANHLRERWRHSFPSEKQTYKKKSNKQTKKDGRQCLSMLTSSALLHKALGRKAQQTLWRITSRAAAAAATAVAGAEADA